MPAALAKSPLNTTPVNSYAVEAAYTISAPGAHHRRQAVEIAAPGAFTGLQALVLRAPGAYRRASQVYRITAVGAKRQLNTFEAPAPGKYSLAVLHCIISAPGSARKYQAVVTAAPGAAVIRNAIEVWLRGTAHMQLPFETSAPGKHIRGLGHIIEVIGAHSVNQPQHTRVYRQGYRVADASLATLELYAGYGAPPDLDAAPEATGDPILWNPTLPGAGDTTVLHLVVCERNAYGLRSFNQQPKLIEINEFGEEELGPITGPELVRVLDGSAAGALQAWMRYPYEADRNPADYWELYVSLGTDPVPGVDAPAATAIMGIAGGLNVTKRLAVFGLTAGATYYVLAAVRRSTDDLRASSAVQQITLIPTYAVDATSVDMFAGEEYEVNQ